MLRVFKKLNPFFMILMVACINPSYSCSVVFDNHNNKANIAARTMDLYMSDEPTLVVYPRGIVRSGQTKENPLKWKSKYGSVVLTVFHTNGVSDGMNEKGLTAHLLYLHTAKYEKRNATRPGVTYALWAQYILDNFDTVNEAVKQLSSYQVVSTKVKGKEWPLHLTIEDGSGDSAVIEFIDGKMVVHHGKEYSVMTNEPAYHIQLENLKKYKLFGGNLPMPGDVDPLSRFVRGSSYLKTLPQPKDYLDAVAGTLSVIRTIMVPFGAVDTSGGISADTWVTRWVTLADMTNKLYYFNATSQPNIIWIDFKNINFNEGSPTFKLDPADVSLIGEISKKL